MDYLNIFFFFFQRFIVLGFNYTSILVVHFVLSPREREERDRRDNGGDERGIKVKKQKKKKHSLSTFSVSQYQLDALVT